MKKNVISIYKQTERFAAITQKLLAQGNMPRVKKCLAYAERLFKNGNNETRIVICNIYVHSLSIFMESRGCRIANLFPRALNNEYLKQINASGV